MLEIQKILAPVDFSEKSEAVARHAVELAEAFDAEPIFLHVLPSEIYSPMASPEIGAVPIPPSPEAEERAAKMLAELAARAGAEGAKRLVHTGDPGAAIADAAGAENADLLVMSTHGRGVFRRLLLGSVAQKALHDAKAPILTGVHLDDAPPFEASRYNTIACAIGLGNLEHAKKTLRTAHGWAEALDARVHVLHAPPLTELGAWEGVPVEAPEDVENRRRAQLAALLEEVGVEAEIHVGMESPTTFVNRVVEQLGADLLVIGRSVRSGLLDGPHADGYAFIRESSVPVLSV